MTKSPVSQKLVAEHASVSQAAVSIILAGKSGCSPATRLRVIKAAERLGYRPNLLVQGMQTGKTRTIGVMAPPVDSYWTEILYGIHDELIQADHIPINIWLSDRAKKYLDYPHEEIDPLEQIHRLVDRRVDGVILWPPIASLYREHIREFSSRNLPVVTIDHELPPKFNSSSVGTDEAAGTALIVNHLMKLGHRRIAHLAGPADVTWAQQRRKEFKRALVKAGISTLPLQTADLNHPIQGIEQARLLLDQLPRPTAIFAATDTLAVSVYQAAEERGLSIPGDLSVVGYSADPRAARLQPPLTTIWQRAYAVGRKAAELVLQQSGSTPSSRQIQHCSLPVSLVVRQSTGPLSRSAVSKTEKRNSLKPVCKRRPKSNIRI